MNRREYVCCDDNIDELRERYQNGLHFVVGDTHCATETLKELMAKTKFDPSRDHVYFVGDYNAHGDPTALLTYMSNYYRADYAQCGFHMIRGNHEWELSPVYPLQNLPDVIVLRSGSMNYYIAHAGMVSQAFDLINEDMAGDPQKTVFAYRLDDCCARYDAPLRQIIWSRRGLYSQRSKWKTWPSEENLRKNRACIIHGHSPYCFFMKEYASYGDNNLFFRNQHVWFSEELQSFNMDSNIKGRYENGEFYRGLACVCLEVLEEVSLANAGRLTVDGLQKAPNGIFAVELVRSLTQAEKGNLGRILNARPAMKTITIDAAGSLTIVDETV